jgi:hypothetical protein
MMHEGPEPQGSALAIPLDRPDDGRHRAGLERTGNRTRGDRLGQDPELASAVVALRAMLEEKGRFGFPEAPVRVGRDRF